VLRAALFSNPKDGRAAYYLGNVLASKLRGDEALVAWRDAVRLDPANVVARRNLARGLWILEGKKDEASNQFEHAIAANKDDYRLYVEMDQLLDEMGATERRLRLLEGAPPSVREHSAFNQALADALTDAGRFDDAGSLLEQHRFTSGEGEEAALAIYRRAHLGLALKYQRSGEHEKAAQEFLTATEYPSNFGVGRPEMRSQAREYVAAARELEKAGKNHEAATLWQRAAAEQLNAPSQPEEPWSEHYYFKALALDHVGRKSEARALFERLARLADDRSMLESEPWPPTGAIRFVLAGAGLRALGRNSEARAAFERALKMDPNNQLAREQIGELRGNKLTRTRGSGGF
jgi:tetratricopeptide (TPR) repeat protein